MIRLGSSLAIMIPPRPNSAKRGFWEYSEDTRTCSATKPVQSPRLEISDAEKK